LRESQPPRGGGGGEENLSIYWGAVKGVGARVNNNKRGERYPLSGHWESSVHEERRMTASNYLEVDLLTDQKDQGDTGPLKEN